MSEEQQAAVARLSRADISRIDHELMSHVSSQWRKVARVVGSAMSTLKDRPAGVPDLYYASRIRFLVEAGALASDGDLRIMGQSEVRLAVGPNIDT